MMELLEDMALIVTPKEYETSILRHLMRQSFFEMGREQRFNTNIH